MRLLRQLGHEWGRLVVNNDLPRILWANNIVTMKNLSVGPKLKGDEKGKRRGWMGGKP